MAVQSPEANICCASTSRQRVVEPFSGSLSAEKGPRDAIRIARAAGMPLRIAAKIPSGETAYFKKQLEPHIGANRNSTSSDRTASAAIALVDIEAVKDGDGNIVGAVNCFQDITERKRTETQIANLAHEAEHRTKNILSTVLATVRLSQSDTADDLKQLIEGRIDALAKVHALFAQSRWAGAELDFALRRQDRGARAN